MKKMFLIIFSLLFIIFSFVITLSFADSLHGIDIKEYKNKDSIHFINTGNSDCILLSSKGEYALIDCGISEEDVNKNEIAAIDVLMPYLGKLIDGDITFKFVLGTHTHRDHIGGFIDLLDEPNIQINEFYIKKRNKAGNKELYNNVIEKMQKHHIYVNYDVLDKELIVGNFNIKILNGEIMEPTKYGDNDNSLALLVSINNFKIFLGGDINNYSKDEEIIANQVGKVDVLKVPHHGYKGSSSKAFLKKLNPRYNIITNFSYRDLFVWMRLNLYTKSTTYVTGHENGIVLVIDDQLKLFNNINKGDKKD